MRTRVVVAALLAATCACASAPRAARLRPLDGEAEVTIYLLPLAREAERLSFTIDSVALQRADDPDAQTNAVPLALAQRSVDGAAPRAEQRVAHGRVAPGRYDAVVVKAGSAATMRGDERARLLVPDDATRAEIHLDLRPGSATVLFLDLKPIDSMRSDYRFSPAFTATVAPQTPPPIALYCADTAGAAVTVVDRRARLTTGAVAVGESPRGIALDRAAARAYVALGAEDQIQILDVAANTAVDRIRLTPGDGPRDVAFAGDGATLLVLNERSRTLAFVDVGAMTELARVPVGDSPAALLVDRSGRRAYVVNRTSATVTVVDIASRTSVTTLTTDPEPVRAQLSRDGTRLYVAHRGSAYLAVFAVPSFAPLARAYVALGAVTIRVDPRTDLVYLARGEERRVVVYDPVSLQPIDQFDVPGAVSYMAIDDAENTLLALMPRRHSIAVVDLTNRRVLTELPVGGDPYAFSFAGERF
jgi:DNA-binding beta-propeller fold protein YncE